MPVPRLTQVSDDGEAASSAADDGELLQGGLLEELAPGRAGRADLLRGGRRGSSGSGSMGGFASEIEPDPEAQQAAAPGSSGALAARVQRAAAAYDADELEVLGEGRGAAARRSDVAGGLIPAVRRSGALPSRPPRYPSKEPAVTLIPGPKQELAAAAAQGPSPPSPSSLHQRHQAHLAQQSPPARSAFLQQRQRDYSGAAAGITASAVPGALAAAATAGSTSPGAAATAPTLRSASASALGRSGRRQLDVEAAAYGQVAGTRGSDSYSFGAQPAAAARPGGDPLAHHASAAAAEQPVVQAFPVAPSSYAPSSYAPSEGVPSSRQSPYSTRAAGAAAAPSAPAALGQRVGQRLGGGSKLLSRLNRGPGLGDSASGSRYDAYSRIRWADGG